MEQQIALNKLLEKLNEIQIDISIIKERLPEEGSEDNLLEQVQCSLNDVKEGRIRQVA